MVLCNRSCLHGANVIQSSKFTYKRTKNQHFTPKCSPDVSPAGGGALPCIPEGYRFVFVFVFRATSVVMPDLLLRTSGFPLDLENLEK